MSKIFTLGTFLFCFLFSSFGQDSIEAHIIGYNNANYAGNVAWNDIPNHDFSGQTIPMIFIDPWSEFNIDIYFTNLSSTTENWIVSRRKLYAEPDWLDFMIRANYIDPFGGVGLAASTMDMELYVMPGSISAVIPSNEKGHLGAHIIPDSIQTGCPTYRYYVGTDTDPFKDSVDIVFCTTLDVEKHSNDSFSVFPNPFSNQIEIIAGNINGEVPFTIADATGKIWKEEILQSTKTSIDVADLQPGIYFVRIGETVRTITKR